MRRRQYLEMKLVRNILLNLVSIFGVVLIWGLLEPYTIDTESEVAEIPNLPTAWKGQKIALIADWQIGMWWGNTNTIKRIVEQLIQQRPAVVLIAGDFIYHAGANPNPEISKAVELINPLVKTGIPTYAVLGNHDYGMDSKQAPPNTQLATQVEQALTKAGVQILQNEAISLTSPENRNRQSTQENSLYLVGIGSHWANNDKPAIALSQIPRNAPRLVLMHNPNSFEKLPANTAPLAVAGHTHGGQVRIPFTPEWSWMTFVKEDRVHVDGWIESSYGQPGNRLYVNRGIGFSIVPIRINCPPEVTLFTLRDAS